LYRLSFQAVANTAAKAANNNGFGFAAADGTPVVCWQIDFWSSNTWELCGPGDVREQLGSPLEGQVVDCAIVVDDTARTFYGMLIHDSGTFISKTYPLGDAKIASVFRMADARLQASGSNGDLDVGSILITARTDEWDRRVNEIRTRASTRVPTGRPGPPPDPFAARKDLHERATRIAQDAANAGTIRITCGATFAFIDPAGNAWFADRRYTQGSFGYVGGGTVHRGPIAIQGADNPEVYRTELWGQQSYHVTVPNGNYLLRLHWAETYGLGPGGRTFDVVVEGETALKDFDAAREAGGLKRAVVKQVDVSVTDGVLDFEFPHKQDVTPMINGIEVMRK